jgi:hypothetical protein
VNNRSIRNTAIRAQRQNVARKPSRQSVSIVRTSKETKRGMDVATSVTTIVYAWELNSGMPTAGINLLWLLVAVVIDLGGLGGSAHRQSRR